jgi:hypothetical protein
MVSFQVPLFLFLGSLAYLFPLHAAFIFTAVLSWVFWQRQR